MEKVGDNKLNKLINDIHKFSKDFGLVSLTPPPRLRVYYRQYKENPHDSSAEGRYCGLLFEHFLTPLLFQATNINPSVRWFIPARKHITLLKEGKRKDRLAYNKDGEIILFDGHAPSAEFDGILRLGRKQIILIEIKHNLSGGKKIVQKTLSRLLLFKAAFKRDPTLLLLVPAEISTRPSREFLKTFESHQNVEVVKVHNFGEFRQMFETNNFPETQKELSQFSSKVKAPHEVFPRSIKFSSYRKILKTGFLEYLKGSLTADQFFLDNQRYIDLLRKIPIGRLSPTCKLGILDKKNRIQSFLNQEIQCVYFMKFRKTSVRPEIIICIKSKKRRYPKFRRSSFSYTEGYFKGAKLSVTKGSITYVLAQDVANDPQTKNLDFKFMKHLVDAGKTLSDYWGNIYSSSS